ncbi:hypothetical protein B0H16DRAFT_1742272 [Mycena metata]|uniref:Uncharacterized protein n=1 Tax=Mycena metata TaxID=1033252 RepID=A0AAD7H8I4_9AGAR|nr:hypothetical protein B0H16DRAFT_1742272 [Mycena metata]
MGPGSRRDTLDSHLSYWNWSKLIGIADLLRRRLDKARVKEREQAEAFETFTAEQGERTVAWRTMVHAFEADPKKPNPYEMKSRGFTEADVRLRLAENDTASTTPSLHNVSPTGFIYAGLDLEEQQSCSVQLPVAPSYLPHRRRTRVSIELKKAHTTAQKINIVAMHQKLTRGINRFRKLQATYTPGALQALARLEENTTEMPETTPLMLPSALSDVEREAGCVGGVQIVEAEARNAQCEAALLRLRHQLHIKSRFLTYKRNHSRHQGANTRSRTLVARNECKIRLHSEKYQAAWNAIRWLQGEDASKVGWLKLCQSDIRLMQDAEDLRKREEQRKNEAARRRRLAEEGEAVEMEDDDDEGWVDEDEGGDAAGGSTESRRTISWIWTVTGTTGSDAKLEEALRIEWAKAYVRSRRWKEEVWLLEEEFRRIVVSFKYEEERWLARARLIPVGEVEEGFAQGAIGYVLQQAAMYRDIRDRAVVTMTEVRCGRGRKRLPGAVGVEDGSGDEGEGEAACAGKGEAARAGEGEAARADKGKAACAGEGEAAHGGEEEGAAATGLRVADGGGEESDGFNSEDSDDGWGLGVYSDEELFMGGEDEEE